MRLWLRPWLKRKLLKLPLRLLKRLLRLLRKLLQKLQSKLLWKHLLLLKHLLQNNSSIITKIGIKTINPPCFRRGDFY